MSSDLKAPFPWPGGKSRAAALIWPRFGDVPNYVEPFAGSLAVLLARPHAPRIETVNDADAMLANFWRSVRLSPDVTAEHADWPVNETDLHARHKWLVARIPEVRALLDSDPEAHDPKVAGWWVWGLCAWIGTGWCDGGKAQLPDFGGSNGGHGRGLHGVGMRDPSRQLPFMGGGANGHPQGSEMGSWGQGVHSKGNRSRILDVFRALSDRLRYARVACGDFERVLSDSVTWRHGTTAILLDPPYPGYADAYSERAAVGVDVWHRAAAWAREHGSDTRLRIALCGYDGDFAPVPDGWIEKAWKAKGGYGNQSATGNPNAARERLWFSPGCPSPDAQPTQGAFTFAPPATAKATDDD